MFGLGGEGGSHRPSSHGRGDNEEVQEEEEKRHRKKSIIEALAVSFLCPVIFNQSL